MGGTWGLVRAETEARDESKGVQRGQTPLWEQDHSPSSKEQSPAHLPRSGDAPGPKLTPGTGKQTCSVASVFIRKPLLVRASPTQSRDRACL